MSGYIDKGRISKIMGPDDWYGLPTRAQVNPNSNSGAITPAITIDWRLRGKNGQLKVGDEVAYCLFDDGTGVIFARIDGENSGIVDYDVTTTGDVVNEKTETTHGDVLNNSNETTIGLFTGTGGMSIKGSGSGAAASITGSLEATGDIVAGSISLQNHVHTEQGDGADVSKPK